MENPASPDDNGPPRGSQPAAQAGCEPLIDAKRAGAILDVSATTVKRMAQAGELPAIQIGNRWNFRASGLDNWLNSRVPSQGHPRPPSKIMEVQ
jgi:excisionase family DNA binding protein